MTKTSKMLLTISAIAFAAGCTNVLGGVGTPLAAVFFGLFMIFNMLEKEMALFDEEKRLRVELAENTKTVPQGISKESARNPDKVRQLTPAHSS
jgi:hypothetical protein